MKKALSFAVIMMTFSTAVFADSIVYSVKGKSEMTLKKVSKKRFEKISESITGQESLDFISSKGSRNLGTSQIDKSDDSRFALEITGKNTLRIEDLNEKISSEVEADIDATMLGRLKMISVSSKTLDTLYAASYERTGLAALKGLNLGSGAITSEINSSDLKCIADEDLLKCEREQELIFTIKGK